MSQNDTWPTGNGKYANVFRRRSNLVVLQKTKQKKTQVHAPLEMAKMSLKTRMAVSGIVMSEGLQNGHFYGPTNQSNCRTYREEFMHRSSFLTFGDCVEKQILQTGQDAGISSPTLQKKYKNQPSIMYASVFKCISYLVSVYHAHNVAVKDNPARGLLPASSVSKNWANTNANGTYLFAPHTGGTAGSDISDTHISERPFLKE